MARLMDALFSRSALCSTSRGLSPLSCQSLYMRHYAVMPKTHLAHKQEEPLPIEPPTSLKTHYSHLSELSSNLKYPLKHSTIAFQPEDYSSPLGKTDHLPFFFRRTPSNKLPIYTDFKVQGTTKVFTEIRKFDGDIKELSAEIARLIPEASIQEHASSLVVSGNHVLLLKYWLMQLGF